MKRIKFHKNILDKVPLPRAGGRDEYQDEDAPELVLRVTSAGQKTFVTRKKIGGKAVRITLGVYSRSDVNEPGMTVAQARKKAARARSEAIDGRNPNQAKRAGRVESKSLRSMLESYVRDSNRLKESTARDYLTILAEVLPDWLDKPLRDVTDERVIARHRKHGERSRARANAAMRVLRAIWNYARTYNPRNAAAIYGDNPVNVLSARKAWYRIERRRTRIKDNALPVWWSGVERLRELKQAAANEVADLLTVLLYTGLRPNEAYELEWRDVDLDERTIEIPDPKNREAHVLPIPGALLEILRRREKARDSKFVFPSPSDPQHPFRKTTMHKFVRVLKDETGVEFTPYDLRRGFATVAESLDISALAVKRLLNHRTAESDVTAGYIGRDTRRLKDAMEKIANRITELTTATSDNVVALQIPAKVG